MHKTIYGSARIAKGFPLSYLNSVALNLEDNGLIYRDYWTYFWRTLAFILETYGLFGAE